MTFSPNSNILNIDISLRSILRIFGFILLIAGIYYIRDLVVVILISIIFGLVIRYIAKVMQLRYKIRSNMSIILVILAVILVIIISLAGIFPLLISQAIAFWNFSQNSFTAIQIYLQNSEPWLPNSFFDNLNSILPNLGRQALDLASIFSQVLLYIFLFIVLSSYIALDFTGFVQIVQLLSPQSWRHQVPAFFERIEQSIGKWAVGHIIVATSVGFFVYSLLLVFGIKYGLALSLIIVIAGIIPLIGPLFGVLMITLVALSQGYWLGFIIFCMIILIHSIRIWLLIPLFIDEQPAIDPLVLLIALMASFLLLGELGLFIVTPLLSLAYLVYSDIKRFSDLV